MTYFSFISRNKYFFGKRSLPKEYTPQGEVLAGKYNRPIVDKDFDAINKDLSNIEHRIETKGTVYSDNSD